MTGLAVAFILGYIEKPGVQSEEPGQLGGEIDACSVKAGGRIAFGEETCC